MERNMKTAREQYRKLSEAGHGKFYFGDVTQIMKMAREENPGDFSYSASAVSIALEIGYAIGWRQAKRSGTERQQRRSPQQTLRATKEGEI